MKKHIIPFIFILIILSWCTNENTWVNQSNNFNDNKKTSILENTGVNINTWTNSLLWLTNIEESSDKNKELKWKITDAYFSDISETTPFSLAPSNYYIPDNFSIADTGTLRIVNNTIYSKDKNNVYFTMMELENIEWYDTDKIRWILPYKWFTGTSLFSTDGSSLYFVWKKVIDWDIKTLRFITFDFNNDKEIEAWDKNNLYIWLNIFKWWDINTITKFDNSCYADKKNLYCQFWEFWWSPFEIIKWVDIDTFSKIERPLYKDKNHIYDRGRILEWVSPDWFDVKKYLKEKNN